MRKVHRLDARASGAGVLGQRVHHSARVDLTVVSADHRPSSGQDLNLRRWSSPRDQGPLMSLGSGSDFVV